MDWIGRAEPRQLARVAGGLYLVNIVLGALAVGIAPAVLVVVGDATATANNIQAHETFYRLSLVANVVVGMTNVPLAMIFWELFKVVDRRIAMLVVFFTLVATAIQVAFTVNQFATLAILQGGAFSTGFDARQAQAMAYLPIGLGTVSYDISAIYFGGYAIAIGYLIFKSTFMPRVIGVLMVLDGVSYITYSLADMIAPGFAAHLVPWLQLPALAGEGSLCLWLLIAGVNPRRWVQRAASAPPAAAVGAA